MLIDDLTAGSSEYLSADPPVNSCAVFSDTSEIGTCIDLIGYPPVDRKIVQSINSPLVPSFVNLNQDQGDLTASSPDNNHVSLNAFYFLPIGIPSSIHDKVLADVLYLPYITVVDAEDDDTTPDKSIPCCYFDNTPDNLVEEKNMHINFYVQVDKAAQATVTSFL